MSAEVIRAFLESKNEDWAMMFGRSTSLLGKLQELDERAWMCAIWRVASRPGMATVRAIGQHQHRLDLQIQEALL